MHGKFNLISALMNSDNSSDYDIRSAILADLKSFLSALQSGASDKQLAMILAGIREKELRLLKTGGTMVSPELWKILHSRLAKRSDEEIIDTSH